MMVVMTTMTMMTLMTMMSKMMMLAMMRKRMMSVVPALPVPVSCWLTNGRVMLLGTTPHPSHQDGDDNCDNHQIMIIVNTG